MFSVGPVENSPRLSIASVQPLLEAAENACVDTQSILDTYAIENHLTLTDYFRVQRDIARQTDDLTANISTRKLTYQTGSFVVEQISKATTLDGIICGLADYFNMMHGGTYNFVKRTPKTITLIIDDRRFPYAVAEPNALVQLVGECLQIQVQCLLMNLSGGVAASALQRVCIKRDQSDETVSHLSFWPRRPKHGNETYALTYDLALARTPIPRPERVVLSTDGIFSRVITTLEEIDAGQNESRLTPRVLSLVEDGEWQQDRVAEHLTVSVATLRRRLHEDGYSFRDLVQNARFKRAKTLLLDGRTIQHVAEATGYSDIRAFNRAFKRLSGTTPAAFAKANLQDA